ncbi:hypothetical protein HNR01_003831 [Methylorubrum rhodesianum]|nr:hypothetical protein [Methylorubrum rhodesianum]
MKTALLVQTFALKRKRLVPGDRQVSNTNSGAMKRAEAMATRMPGTAALQIVADDEIGELESGPILGQYGEVDESVESLRAA